MKIRLGFVSNSSSSSFVIACKGKELAEYVADCYSKLFDYFMEINPKNKEYVLDRDNYKISSIKDILDHFKEYGMDERGLKIYRKQFEEQEKNGYVFLLGNCASDDGTCEYNIMTAFNEWVLYDLQNKENIDIVFEQRWS